ncbi:MAG: hypothetical protein ACE5KU_02235 [Nitrososphaerales archaeon]
MKRQGRRERAVRLVESRSIKLHRFLPSGREVWTAVGNDGDQLVDASQPYCSCRDFHFRLLTGRREECYHLLALKMAKESNSYDTIDFQDEEYTSFIRGLLEELPHEG